MNRVHTRKGAAVGDGSGSSSRRDFLRLAGMGGAALMLPTAIVTTLTTMLTACDNEQLTSPGNATFDVSTTAGVLNLAYVATQFQWRFYENVTFAPFIGATTLELGNPISSAISKMGQHAQSQARVFANTLPANEHQVSDTMQFSFRTIDFSSRAPVYAFAIQMEDMTAALYNTLLLQTTDADAISLLSKIASVEARHAAAIRDLADIAAGNSDTANRTSFASDTIVSPATGVAALVTAADYVAFMKPYAVGTLTMVGG